MDSTLSDPMVGRRLDGRYRVEARIDSGGMATVYLATDTRLERRVAVKVMHPHLADDRLTAERFEREARSAARLSHPDVVSVYDQGSDEGAAFLVMEYVPGVNLREILRAQGRLSPGEALAVMDHVLAALGAAHDAGLAHRDVKPENVLVTADGRVKVADFGLARALVGTTLTTSADALVGTAAYIAPETIEHGVVDARSDVYAAGVMLFELLTGSPPFPAGSAHVVMHRQVAEDVPPPSSRTPGIPAELDGLVTTATSRDPGRRPATAAVMHADLVGVRDRLGIHGRVPALPAALTTPLLERSPTAVTAAVDPVTQAVPPAQRPPTAASGSPSRRRRRWPLLLVALAVTIALAITAGWWLASGRYTHAPSLIGLSRNAAAHRLTDAGLHARWLSPVHSATVPAGQIAVESPHPGDRVTHGGTVSLRLSSGPVTHVLPSYENSTVSTARSNLEALHLKVGKNDHAYSPSVAKGRVVSTTPTQGTTVDEGSTVSLVVSKGPAPVAVPAVAKLSAADATDALSSAGFTVTTKQKYDDTIPSGQAIDTSPPTGTREKPGTAVTLHVSKGPHLYPVPDVHGQPISQAIKTISAAGFTPNPKEIFPFGPDHVVRETPQGSQKHGTTIELDYY